LAQHGSLYCDRTTIRIHLAFQRRQALKLSIIIPIAPGDGPPLTLIKALAPRPGQSELLLAPVEALDLCAYPDLQQLPGPPGRGRQQNRAAARARGQWLWFIHSDSQLESDALTRALAFTQRTEPAIGYGWLRFANDGPALTWLNATGANLRSRWPGWPYGDQGLCLPQVGFQALQGFREDLERGEDLDLVVRARRIGLNVSPMQLTVTTSAQRYRERGWLKTSLEHQIGAWRLFWNAR
jgi:hypothetical protein